MFKIISSAKLAKMKQRISTLMTDNSMLSCKLNDRRKEYEDLYHQCCNLENKVNELQSEINAQSKINANKNQQDGHTPHCDSPLHEYQVLRSNSYPCDKCTMGNGKCMKLDFNDRTICITHRDNVNTFSKPKNDKKNGHRIYRNL